MSDNTLPFSSTEYDKLDMAVFPTIRRRDKYGEVGDVVTVRAGENGDRLCSRHARETWGENYKKFKEVQDDECVQSYPFGGSLNVPFACSDECWLDAQDDPQLIADGGQVEDDTDQDLVSDLLSWAKQEKANARGRYHDEESGSFEQGIPLGRLHAMSDVIEFIYENRSTDTENEQDDFKE